MTNAVAGEVEIRRASRDDLARFDRVAADVFDGPIDRGRLAAYLAEPGHRMIVAVRDGEVVGQVAAVVHRHPDKPTELYLDEVGVTPVLHRRGIARQMLDTMFAWGRELGCEEVWVGTEPENAPVRGLYESRGSEPEPFVMYVYEL